MTTQDRLSMSPRWTPMVGSAGATMVCSSALRNMASMIPAMILLIAAGGSGAGTGASSFPPPGTAAPGFAGAGLPATSVRRAGGLVIVSRGSGTARRYAGDEMEAGGTICRPAAAFSMAAARAGAMTE